MREQAKRDDGGPAFGSRLRQTYIGYDPRIYATHEVDMSGGMSLRDYFAAQAMAAIIARNGIVDHKGEGDGLDKDGMDTSLRNIPNDREGDADARAGDQEAAAAYEVADAMLKARGQ